MAFSISYYPDSAAGIFGKPAEAKGVCSYHMPELEKIAKKLFELPITLKTDCKIAYFKEGNRLIINQKPLHISLEANSPKELSDLAFELSEELNKAGFPYYSLPFDYSQVVEVKSG